MSVFENANQSDDTPKPTEAPTDYVDALVKAKGEQWSDPQAIAKGKLEADEHISNLEKQLAEMREDVAKNDYASKVLAALENKDAAQRNTPQPTDDGNTGTQNTTGDTSVDIESLVEKTLTEREQKAKVTQNVDKVNKALTEAFGTEATKVVQEKAQSLGMSIERMQDLAGESPDAFLALVGGATAPEKGPDVSSSVNTSAAAFNRSGEKNWAYYQQMRRDNPTQYYKPTVQNEMVAARQQLGEKFYN